MPENHQNHSNVGSILPNGPVNNIQEGIKKMEIEKKKEVEEGIEYPERPGEQDCYYYLRHGTCGYASNCRFNHPPLSAQSKHPQREGQPDCGHYVKTGNCKFGPTCKYHHPLDRRGAEDIILNSLGLPIRKEKACPFYISWQKCKFGAACKFDHPEPTLIETGLPVSQANAVGIGPSSPSNGIPYFGAFPTWPWASSSCFPAPQPYMPYFIPALQGAVATQNWNNYPGNMSSVAGPNVMGTNLVYNCKNPGEMVPGGQWDLSTTMTCNLPERPDQPECQYFMKNGGCKYGSKCRFHHPKEMVSHNFGPHGLPLRPGEDISAHFSPYGYISGYYISMPPMLVPQNQPFIPSQRKLTITSSTETSQTKSSKITEWIQKPESENRQDSTTKPVDDSDEKVNDQSSAANTATNDEIPQEQSN